MSGQGFAERAVELAKADPIFREKLRDLVRNNMTDHAPGSEAHQHLQLLLDQLAELGEKE